MEVTWIYSMLSLGDPMKDKVLFGITGLPLPTALHLYCVRNHSLTMCNDDRNICHGRFSFEIEDLVVSH